MKKTLVALAVLAASGASFAQATITGSYIAGFVTDTTNAGLTTAGLATDTAAIAFAASEDIGGGLKASAKVAFKNAAYGAGFGADDAFVQLEGGFGKVKLGAMESGQAYDVATPGGGNGFDGKVLGNNVTSDSLTYSLPAFGPVVVSVGYGDYSATAGTAGSGGTDAGAASQASSNIAVAYTGGALSITGKYVMYRNQELGGADSNVQKSRYLVRAAYDFGFAQVGLGLASTTYANVDASQQLQLGVSAPFGALTLGAKYATNKDYLIAGIGAFGGAGVRALTSTTAVAEKRTGYTLSADYALSKRTSIGAAAYNYTADYVNGTAASGNFTGYRVLVGHSF